MVYVNGRMVPESQAVISVFDRGFRWGDGVYDVERTYNGEIFRVRKHMERLYRSLKYTRIDSGLTIDEMEQATLKVLDANRHLLGPHDDYDIVQVVSRGVVWPPDQVGPANVVIYCYPIPFASFAHRYIEGCRLATAATRRTPPQSLSPNAKISNKMNHHVADMEVKAQDPEAQALMLDLQGNIAEIPTNNFLFMAGGRLKVPNRNNVLHGITMTTVIELCEGVGIPVDEGDYTPFAVYQADEAIITGTSSGVLPVASLNGVAIGREMPGPITRRLWQAWADLTGVDLVEQALSHLSPERRQALAAAMPRR